MSLQERRPDADASASESAEAELSKINDFTAVLDFKGLTPATTYDVTAEFHGNALQCNATETGNRAYGTVRTYTSLPEEGPFSFSFVLLSCNLSIVSINNLAALMLALGGVAAASRSLRRPTSSWRFPPSWILGLRRILQVTVKLLLWSIVWLVRKATGVKQPEKPFIKSAFAKLCDAFDIYGLEFKDGRSPPAVDDVLEEVGSGTTGELKYPVIVTSGAWKTADARGMMLLSGVDGQFSPDARLMRGNVEVARVARNAWYERPDFFLHAGDQIYYDFPFPQRRPARDEYRLAYREAWFEDESLRAFLSRWPHYMILDDHEIADQFARDFDPPAEGTTADRYLDEAAPVYREYVHSRNPPQADSGQPSSSRDESMSFAFDRGTTRFFALDTRTRRYHGTAGGPSQMIDREQMSSLLTWMEKYRDDLKFVVTSVPFVAQVVEAEKDQQWYGREGPPSDKWSGDLYREQREQIIEHIEQHGVKRLVFLTGDAHCCYHATMRIGRACEPEELRSPNGRYGPVTARELWKYDSTTVHELAGGPAYQLQLANIDQFDTRHSSRTETRGVPFEVRLDRFHSSANAVVHIKVDYAERTGLGAEKEVTPEVEWSVIRTLSGLEPSNPDSRNSGEPEKRKPSKSDSRMSGEPAMTGRICFSERRDVDTLPTW